MKRILTFPLVLGLLMPGALYSRQLQPASVSSFTPPSGPIGTTVTITGTNFSSTAANNIVFFGATMANVTGASTTQLTVTVPAGATYQPISVTVGGLTGYSSRPFIVTFPTVASITSGSMASKVDFATGTQPVGVAIGDIDGDGKPDLVVVNAQSFTLSVFRNTSPSGSITSGSFAAKVDFATGLVPYRVAIGDIDGDGKPDLVVTNINDNTVSVFRNTSSIGSISFAARVDVTTGAGPVSAVIEDIDGDGKPDLVVANQNSNTVSVLRNTGSLGLISFAAKVDITTGARPVAVAIGDIDGDGQPDLVIVSYNSNTGSVLRNTSSVGSITPGSFAAKVDFATGTNPWAAAIGDIDGDGKPDLVVANEGGNTVSVFRNSSSSGSITSSSFGAKVDLATGNTPFGVAIGDIDGDGKPDLVVTNATDNTVSVFRNTSSSGSLTTGSFAARIDFTTGVWPSDVAVGDLDGDGKPDLVTAGSVGNSISILRNIVLAPAPITNPLGGRWIQTGPEGGMVDCFAVSPASGGSGTNLFAGSDGGGVYLSTNNGTSWTAINTGLTESSIHALAVSGTNLFAGTGGGGVFVSTNNGTSWTAVNSGLTNNYVYALAVSPNGTGGANLFAGTDGGGVFVSTNNGTSWTAASTGLTNTSVRTLAVSGTNLFAGTEWGVFLSTNNGTSWTAVSSGLTTFYVTALSFSPASGGSGTNLFVGTAGGVFLSTNNGTSWTPAGLSNTIVQSLAVAANGTGGTNLFAGTQTGGVYLSTNNGTSWTAVNSGLMNTGVVALALSGTNLFAGTLNGVYLSSNNGTSWTTVDSGINSTAVFAVAVAGTNIFIGTGGVFLSTDNGTSWSAASTGMTSSLVTSFAVSGTNLFAGTLSGGIFLSTNNGTNWTAVNIGNIYINVWALAVSGANLFAGTDGGVYLSTNDGTSWSAASTGLTNTSVNALSVAGTNLFAGTSGGGVFLSTNNGTSWTAVNSGLTNTSVRALAVSATSLFAGTDGGVFVSTNNGTSWTAVNSGLPTHTAYIWSLTVSPNGAGGTNLFAGTQFGEVYFSTNSGTSWTAASTGLPNTIVHALAVSPASGGSGTYLLAGTYGGFWRRPLSVIITSVPAEGGSTNVPTHLSLEQNYPNPFNPTTMIRFQLPAKSYVSMKVYDMLGREVFTLVNGDLSAGVHEVSFDASRLAGGVYLYRITAGNFTETKKLVLLK